MQYVEMGDEMRSKKQKIRKIILEMVFCMLFLVVGITHNVKANSTNETKVYEFCKNVLGVNDAATCGILANIYHESGFNPNAEFVEADGSLSYGICQWNSGRLTNLKTYCANNGYSYTSIEGQLKFLKHELEGTEKSAYSKIKNVSNDADGAYQAGYNWARYFERCASRYYQQRGERAQNVYWPKYGNSTLVTLDVDAKYATYMPLKAYLRNKDIVYPCKQDCFTATGGEIWSTDCCTILEIYTNGWCKVEYPVGTTTKVAYVPLTVFLISGEQLERKQAVKSLTTYSRGDFEVSIGNIDPGDTCIITGQQGNATQAIYPTPTGYKLGWTSTAEWEYKNTEPDVRFNPYCPIKGYTLSQTTSENTYESDYVTEAGKIFVEDYCTLNEVYDNGWCQVTYPASGGTKTKYIPLSAFIADTSATPEKYTATTQILVYTKEDMANTPNWWISYGDIFFVIIEKNNISQVMYPIDEQYGGGYKLGWIYSAEIPKTTYTVSYHANGGTNAPGNQQKLHNVDLQISDVIPQKDGCTFAGWSKDVEATVVHYVPGSTYSLNQSATLYAVWTKKKYTVTYNVNGGTGIIPEQIKLDGIDLTLTSEIPIKSYCITYDSCGGSVDNHYEYVYGEFLGWSVNKNAKVPDYYSEASYSKNEDITLYAIYADANMGALQNCTKNNYKFNGWYTAKEEGQRITESTLISSDITVYAQWSEVENNLYGDVNDDGKVNTKDYALLQQYLNGWDVTINQEYADVNCDGKINVKDYALLEQYLNGWDINFGSTATEIHYQKHIYGQSELGRDLEYYSFTPENYQETVLLNFAIHGFEDEYNADGQVLVDTAEELIAYYNKNPEKLGTTRLMIIPCANPDGLYEGTTNNGFGRCNAKGIDLNRDFDANYQSYSNVRNYTPYAFSAAESRALRDLVERTKADVVIDFHGWLNYTIGNYELAQIFKEELNLSHHTDFTTANASGYFANWAYQQGALGLLVEFKSSTEISFENLVNATNRILEKDYVYSKEDKTYQEFENIQCYTLSTERVTTYQHFDVSYSGTSYINGETDLVTILDIYENGWVKVEYPVSSGKKVAYTKLEEFISPNYAVDIYEFRVSDSANIYKRESLTDSFGMVYPSDKCYVVADNGDTLQIISKSDTGVWKMGWISR